jgi:hypothetical protein
MIRQHQSVCGHVPVAESPEAHLNHPPKQRNLPIGNSKSAAAQQTSFGVSAHRKYLAFAAMHRVQRSSVWRRHPHHLAHLAMQGRGGKALFYHSSCLQTKVRNNLLRPASSSLGRCIKRLVGSLGPACTFNIPAYRRRIAAPSCDISSRACAAIGRNPGPALVFPINGATSTFASSTTNSSRAPLSSTLADCHPRPWLMIWPFDSG